MQVVSKTQLMSMVTEGVCHESFEHSVEGKFDITAMRKFAQENPSLVERVFIGMDQFLEFITQNRVFDPYRPKDLSDESWQTDPGIAIVFETPRGPEHCIADGVHRALRRAAEGKDDMEFWIFTEQQAIRPSENFVPNPFYDWGDKFVDGKIIKR